ncbi:MAG: M20/M25/M40 family metallo-hydrolase [Chloroflexi bacterium]|nr:MAG: M20/M25/M40 family metallo-hydrolase [Chloroflexota bacterium]MBL1193234.1 M42 family peptidase [Chloroflexota bacterium]NOH10529.1 M42 family metallopeptidase [Chloroflexota bacterium]
MPTLPAIDSQYLLDTLVELLNIPSPTGYTEEAVAYSHAALSRFDDLELKTLRKGALTATWIGESHDTPRALTAHVDTLGAMVKEIKSNGRLQLTRIGGYAWNTVEGEGCNIFTANGETVRGSLLLTKSSSHVHSSKVNETRRGDSTMEVRLDARTTSADETRALGIEVGDFVAFDPRVEVTNDFVRSRHLDDKACVATMLAAIKALQDARLKPTQTTTFHISNYEEVGHGAAVGFPDDLAELVTLDMAAIGDGQTSDEFHTTLCVKDSGGPYHYGLNQKLRQLAEEHDIPYKVDIYPYYGSDGEAYWRSGGDVAVALIGPGVDASHNYERTHMEALIATTQWTLAYLLS